MILFILGIMAYIPIMRFIESKDKSYACGKKTDILPVILSIIGFIVFTMMGRQSGAIGSLSDAWFSMDVSRYVTGLILGISTAFLCCTAICDNRTTQIFDVLYIPPTIICLGYGLYVRRSDMPGCLSDYIGIAIFILFQFLILSRCYGMSDVFAYSSLACIGTVIYATEWTMVFCMFTSFCAFVITQAARKNIRKNLKLKEEKALIPFIVGSYWPTLALCKFLSRAFSFTF